MHALKSRSNIWYRRCSYADLEVHAFPGASFSLSIYLMRFLHKGDTKQYWIQLMKTHLVLVYWTNTVDFVWNYSTTQHHSRYTPCDVAEPQCFCCSTTAVNNFTRHGKMHHTIGPGSIPTWVKLLVHLCSFINKSVLTNDFVINIQKKNERCKTNIFLSYNRYKLLLFKTVPQQKTTTSTTSNDVTVL